MRLFQTRAGIGILVLLFLACLAPYAAFFLVHHPDERHYTDAGIEMVRRGDYLTPYTAEGAPRLKKPIIPYGMIAVSYRCFGVSPASSRLPFLLAGGAVVWLTYRLAMLILEDRSWSLLAALMVACNPSLVISAPRSVPDIFLCLFLLLSAIGFVAMIASGGTSWGAVAAAYGGGSLAILSKGLPAAAFVGYAVAFLLLTPTIREGQKWRRHAIGWCGGLALAASWFVLMSMRHGDGLISAFLQDQLGDERLAPSTAASIKHFFLIVALITACLLPWLVPLVGSRFDGRAFLSRIARRPEHLFLLGWTATWIGLASMVERVNLRYLLPLAPLLSVLAAQAWKEADPARLAKAARPGWWLAIAALIAATAGSAVVMFAAGDLLVGLLLLVGATWIVPALVTAGRNADALELARLATTACLLVLAVGAIGLGRLVLPDPAQRIAAEIRDVIGDAGSDLRAVWIGEPAVAARIRVYLRGEIPLGHALPPASDDLDRADLVLMRSDEPTPLGPGWSEVRTFTHGYRGMDARDLLRAALAGQLHSFLESQRRHVTIAVRQSSPGMLSRGPSGPSGIAANSAAVSRGER